MCSRLKIRLVLLLIILNSGPTTPCSSSCSSNCDCANRGLSSVPQNLPTSIASLQLWRNAITSLSSSDLSRYRSLTKFSASNQIAIVQPAAFSNLIHLERLYLTYNKLTSIQAGVFSNIPKLTELFLRHNNISSIPSSAFSNLPSLEMLTLLGNSISYIQAGAFSNVPKLERLYLSRNHLTNVHPESFANLPRIRTLDLSKNRIANIESDTFSKIPTLQELDLESNQISVIQPGTFSHLRQLEELEMASNQITNIMPGAFSNLLKLKHLELPYNHINKIKPGTLSNLPSLQQLCLEYNQMTIIQPDTFSNLPKHTTLTWHNNPWQCDCRMVAFRSWMPRSQWFENEVICEEPSNFRGLKLQNIEPENLICEKPTVTSFQRRKDIPLMRRKALNLDCKASGIPQPDITIILPSGRNATVESDGRVTVNENGTIIVRDLTKADSGSYVCIAANHVGSTFATLFVDIIIPTSAISTTSTLGSTDNPVVKGSKFASKDSYGSTPFTLSADGNMSSAISTTSQFGDRNTSAAISPGIFTTLYEDPITLRFERIKNNTLVWCVTLLLVCKGIPSSNITVNLPSGLNRSVDESVGRLTVEVNGTITITITNVTAENAGLYSYIAMNPVGSTSATLTVDIKGPCSVSSQFASSASSPTDQAEINTDPVVFSLSVGLGSIAAMLSISGVVFTLFRRRSRKPPLVCVLTSIPNNMNTVVNYGKDMKRQEGRLSTPGNTHCPASTSDQANIYENSEEAGTTDQAIIYENGEELLTSTTKQASKHEDDKLAGPPARGTVGPKVERPPESLQEVNITVHKPFTYGSNDEETAHLDAQADKHVDENTDNSQAINRHDGEETETTPSRFNIEDGDEADEAELDTSSQFIYGNDNGEAMSTASTAIYKNNRKKAKSAAFRVIYGNDDGDMVVSTPPRLDRESDNEAEAVSYVSSQFIYENQKEEAASEISAAIYKNNGKQAKPAASDVIYGNDDGQAADDAPQFVYENNDI